METDTANASRNGNNGQNSDDACALDSKTVAQTQELMYTLCMQSLHDQLLRAMQDSGLTYGQIASGSGVLHAQISRFLNHGQRLNVENTERIANFLGYDVVLQPKQVSGRKWKQNRKGR